MKPTLYSVLARATLERAEVAGWTLQGHEACFWGAVAFSLALRIGCERLGYGRKETEQLVRQNVEWQGALCE